MPRTKYPRQRKSRRSKLSRKSRRSRRRSKNGSRRRRYRSAALRMRTSSKKTGGVRVTVNLMACQRMIPERILLPEPTTHVYLPFWGVRMRRWENMSGAYKVPITDHTETSTTHPPIGMGTAVCTICMKTEKVTTTADYIPQIKDLCSTYSGYDVIVFTDVDISHLHENFKDLYVVTLTELKADMNTDASESVEQIFNQPNITQSAYGLIDLMKVGATMYSHRIGYEYVWYIDLFKMCFTPITNEMFTTVNEVGLLMALYEKTLSYTADEKWAHFTHSKVLTTIDRVYSQLVLFSKTYTFDHDSVISRWANHLIVVFLNAESVFNEGRFICCGHTFQQEELYRLMHRSNYIHIGNVVEDIMHPAVQPPLLTKLSLRASDNAEAYDHDHTFFKEKGSHFFYTKTEDILKERVKLVNKPLKFHMISHVDMMDDLQYTTLDKWAIMTVIEGHTDHAWFDGTLLFTSTSNLIPVQISKTVTTAQGRKTGGRATMDFNDPFF